MPTRYHTIAPLIATLFVAHCALTLTGCATGTATAPPLLTLAREEHSAKSNAQSVNLETLEAESALETSTPPETRDLRLSTRWYERAEELSSVAGPGSLAALLRSAHFAVESLLSEPCANPFNETCRDLHKLYLRSTEKIVREVARNGWELPQLAPSRYRFSNTDAERLRSLRHWRFSLDATPVRGPFDRPGLGLPAVGCREGWGDDAGELAGLSICSPITFIITFERSTQEERPTAHLAAINAYEQELFETRGVAVPVASASTAALDTLLRSADATGGSARLWCVSKPDRTTTMALFVNSSPTRATPLAQAFGSVVTSPELQSTLTPCVYTANPGGSMANATDLLRLMRALVAPRKDAPIEREPIRLIVLLSGKDAGMMARSMLARIKRQAHRASHAPNQPTPFFASAIGVNSAEVDAATMQDISRYARDLGTFVATSPDYASLLLDIPNILRDHRHSQTSEVVPSVPTSGPATQSDELPLSPVM